MGAIANGGTYELGAEMRNRHMIATVGYDETVPMSYPPIGRNSAYVHGVIKGTPEYGYRAVLLTMGQLKGAAWYADGEYMWATTALVPDHIGRLKAYDVVEFRQLNASRSLENFSKNGEGNVIVKVHCRRADGDFEACKKALPQIGKFGPGGDTGIPYPASVKEYGFTFTPAYDANGTPVRPIPEHVPKVR